MNEAATVVRPNLNVLLDAWKKLLAEKTPEREK